MMVVWRAVVCLVCGLVVWAMPAQTQAQGVIESEGALRVGVLYTDGRAAPSLDDFYYINPYFRMQFYYVAVEIETPAVPLLVDAIIAGISYLAGGEGVLPLYDLLNPEVIEPGWIPMFGLTARWNLLHADDVVVGVGPRMGFSLFSPYYAGERAGLGGYELGVDAAAALRFGGLRVEQSFLFGNGWYEEGVGFSPYFGASLSIEYAIGRGLGVYARGQGRLLYMDRSGRAPSYGLADDARVREPGWWQLVAADGGFLWAL